MIEAQSRFRPIVSERFKNQGPDACRSWIESENVKLEDYEGRKVDRGQWVEGWDLRRSPSINRDSRNGGTKTRLMSVRSALLAKGRPEECEDSQFAAQYE
jgi:hypothetical protein